MGDARLNLEREDPQRFDVFALDAFSSDAIPTHLLTSEAFGIYLKHLAPGGLIAVHISNRHFTLEPVVDAVADAHHLASATVTAQANTHGGETSTWVILARDETTLEVTGVTDNADPPSDERVLWTDSRSSMFQVLRERRKLLDYWRKIWPAAE